MTKLPFCAALAVLLCGCAARIDTIQVSAARQGQPIPVAVDVTPFMTTVLSPETFTRADAPGSVFQPDAHLSGGGGHYTGNLAPRNYGAHYLRVEVPYRLPLVSGTSRTSKEQKFFVGGSEGCFTFDGTGVEGWRMVGIFDGGDPNIQVSTCQPIDSVAFATGNANWPELAPGQSGLAWPLGPGCFPSTANSVASGFWSFDFVSPSLEGRAGWTGQSAVTFRIRSSDALIYPNALQVQPILIVRKPDGTETSFIEATNAGPRFEVIPADWTQFTFQFSPPAGSVPLGLHIRIFGRPAVRSNDIAVQLDGVCPGT